MAIKDLINRFGGVTESYWFYKDSDDPVELRYDDKDHVYLLVTPDGLEKQDGVTTVCHIVDKSNALVPWAAKMAFQKALRTAPTPIDGVHIMTTEEMEKWLQAAKDAHKDKLEEAGEIGHIAHAWIEDYIKLTIIKKSTPDGFQTAWHDACNALDAHMLKLKEINEKSASCCRAALEWMQKHSVRWIGTERKIYSRKYRYAGTMDGLCICSSCDNPLCCPELFKDRLTVADWKTSNSLYLEYLFQTAAYEQAYEEETGDVVEDRWVIRLGKEDGEFEPWHIENENFADDFDGFVECLRLVRRVRAIEERIRDRKAGIRAAAKAERDAAKEAKEAAEKAKKALAKETAQRERLEALRLACMASKSYKGVRKPTCKANDGAPCAACARIYAEAQAAKAKPKEKTCQVSTSHSEDQLPTTSSPNSLLAVLVPKTKQPVIPVVAEFRPFGLLPATTGSNRP